jgi:hypothetical protein
MSLAFRPSSLAPPGLVVDDVLSEPNRFVIKAHGTTASCPCPACGCPSTRVHSRYTRWLTDLPSAGKSVHLEIVARDFAVSLATARDGFSSNLLVLISSPASQDGQVVSIASFTI